MSKERQKPIYRFFYLASEAWIVCKLLSKVKNKFKKYIIYLCDFGIDIFITDVYLLIEELYFGFQKNLTLRDTLSLTLRDTLERTPKVISNQNLFSRFQSWCWFWCWPLQKNQAIWLALKILGTQGFPLQPGWSGASSISQKVTKSLPIRVSPHQIYTLLLEVGH